MVGFVTLVTTWLTMCFGAVGDMTNQVSEFPTERTFQYQHSLPPLPVPSLEGSLAKYLDAVRPFATEEEYQVTAAVVKRFGEGIGKDLHQKLLQRARTRRNWLEEWWLDAAYLELRYPSQLNVNFGGPAPYLEHCWPPTEGVQLQRTSISMWHTLQYWDLLRTERLDPHKAGNVVLDMDQFRMLFCTCKVPGVTKDTIINYFKTESEGPCPSHVVVMCKGRFFSFDAVCDGHILTPPELLRYSGRWIFRYICVYLHVCKYLCAFVCVCVCVCVCLCVIRIAVIVNIMFSNDIPKR
ncbi:unnamed protein product [Oncorhynchus mykiss]|uniref:Choline/carnitine acyltransferase domain-containing protein n=1 Tax=Oncorhynchus mykiss TaxID=8022 RepID=A0A060Y9B7_ONCMY|nr:unnamed protein product [Oncorhynchus mykiss]